MVLETAKIMNCGHVVHTNCYTNDYDCGICKQIIINNTKKCSSINKRSVSWSGTLPDFDSATQFYSSSSSSSSSLIS